MILINCCKSDNLILTKKNIALSDNKKKKKKIEIDRDLKDFKEA